MGYQEALIILIIVIVGIPLAALIFFICRRLHEMHLLAKTRGTIYVAADKSAYLEIDDESAFDNSKIVLRVKKLNEKRGGTNNGSIQEEA